MHPVELLPTFAYDCIYAPVFLRILFKRLKRLGVQPTPQQANGLYRQYHGDLAEIGKGEILISA
jgi:formylmethanofuran dehydrogenase subunit C